MEKGAAGCGLWKSGCGISYVRKLKAVWLSGEKAESHLAKIAVDKLM